MFGVYQPCFPPGCGLFLTFFSAGLQIWSWAGAGETENRHRRRRVMGNLTGLGWAEGVVAGRGGAVGSCQTLENKGEVLCSLAWCLCSERAGPVQLLLPAALPCCISSSLSRPLCLPLPDPWVGDEQGWQAGLYGRSFGGAHSLLTFHSRRWLHRPSAELVCQAVS